MKPTVKKPANKGDVAKADNIKRKAAKIDAGQKGRATGLTTKKGPRSLAELRIDQADFDKANQKYRNRAQPRGK